MNNTNNSNSIIPTISLQNDLEFKSIMEQLTNSMLDWKHDFLLNEIIVWDKKNELGTAATMQMFQGLIKPALKNNNTVEDGSVWSAEKDSSKKKELESESKIETNILNEIQSFKAANQRVIQWIIQQSDETIKFKLSNNNQFNLGRNEANCFKALLALETIIALGPDINNFERRINLENKLNAMKKESTDTPNTHQFIHDFLKIKGQLEAVKSSKTEADYISHLLASLASDDRFRVDVVRIRGDKTLTTLER
jgi:hypothetical protein